MTYTQPAPEPGHHPARPRSKKKPLKIAAAVIGVPLLLLASCATGAAIGSDPDATPQPTATETVEVPGDTETVEVPGPERTVEVETEVEVTPDACLEALDLSEEGFDLAAQSMSIMQDALNAAASFDVAGIEAANAQLEAVVPQLDAVAGPLNAAKAECRAS